MFGVFNETYSCCLRSFCRDRWHGRNGPGADGPRRGLPTRPTLRNPRQTVRRSTGCAIGFDFARRAQQLEPILAVWPLGYGQPAAGPEPDEPLTIADQAVPRVTLGAPSWYTTSLQPA